MRKQITFEELYDHFQARVDENKTAAKLYGFLNWLTDPDKSDLLGLVDDYLLFCEALSEYRAEYPYNSREDDLYLEALVEAEDRSLGALIEWIERTDERFRFPNVFETGALFAELLDSDPAEVATA